MARPITIFILKSYVIFMVLSCEEKQPRQFERISPSQSGVHFNNRIHESDTLNLLTFEYLYNGGGVGVGDFNNDNQVDVFFSGNMVSSELYLNRGNFKFQNVTAESGLTTTSWCTGISVADVNADGWLDVYVSTVHPHPDKSSPNLLFINKGVNKEGIPLFEERGQESGLDDRSYTTHAAFFDYDIDGDLDLYLLTNALENYTRNTPIGQRHDGAGKSVDKLYRNDGLENGIPQYKDVSAEAGILSEGWGLGLAIGDVNQDGFPDIYAANDFLSNDHLYINQGNGVFRNEVAQRLKHQEYNGMGADLGDINNDGLLDLLVVDMMPEDNLRQKTMFSNTGYDRFHKNIQMNYQPQYVRNVLQLNTGGGKFTDIGYLSGIYATDWSWSGLISDFDNDGLQDIFITNGYKKDITDLDFVAYSKESSLFGTDSMRLKKSTAALSAIEGVRKPNVLFKNTGDFQFGKPACGLEHPSYSNGAAYADFDNDGDLDLAINNINDPAFIYKNNSIENLPGQSNFLQIKLNGNHYNTHGYGAKMEIRYHGKKQFREHGVHRGYQSSVDGTVHFGLGNEQKIDTVIITWPGNKTQMLTNISANTLLVVKEANATRTVQVTKKNDQPLFSEVPSNYGIVYTASEEDFVDFKVTPTLIRKHSQEGPALAVGDINNDGLEDLVIGGAAEKSATAFIQSTSGSFKKHSLPFKKNEDTGILLFDADNDNDADLYCVSGSSEFGLSTTYYQDRLYENDGHGNFSIKDDALLTISSSGSCVVSADFDKDGDQDLFVGGRIKPQNYPFPPRSYILQNDGHGKFTDITDSVAPSIKNVGMVTSALWTDFDNDEWLDLIIVGEWMPIKVFRNKEGKTLTMEYNDYVGWWNSISGGDMDNDGDTDYILGNLGLNSIYKATEAEPVTIYAKDFDNNGSVDPVITRYIDKQEFPTHPRETLTDQIPALKRTLTRYATYGKMQFADLLTESQLGDALIIRATCLTSAYLKNNGSGKFQLNALPIEAQFAPINGVILSDIDNDNNLDILATGNSFSPEPLFGLYDACNGMVLKGDGRGNFKSLSSSGYYVDGDTKAFVTLFRKNEPLFVSAVNNGPVKVFEHAKKVATNNKKFFRPLQNDCLAHVIFPDGTQRKIEFYNGSGYLSQSSKTLQIPINAKKISVTTYNSKTRDLNVSEVD